ncbi:glycoside hydrolase family 108 protein, partial [Agrobacterium sp. DKPNP3]|uniref:glycoside hydrolase family 108 protein n=1 Tax=Agrobacterium sp. DKPNP3 TaxID=3457323 RepID=UPI004044B916
MSDRFTIYHNITAKWEGGCSNHKADPGGKTMYGVTEAVYHAWLKKRGLKEKPVRNISISEALIIYREQYWNPTAVEFHLFPGVDLAVYDAAVNSGVSRGIKWLKAAAGSNDHSETVKRICRARLSFMQSLAIWKQFGKGWGRRVADIEAKGVAMALAAMGVSEAAVKVAANKEAEAAKKQASTA